LVGFAVPYLKFGLKYLSKSESLEEELLERSGVFILTGLIIAESSSGSLGLSLLLLY
jgi:hypothetical protein